MKRLALVLVLQFSVPYLASAQRPGTSGSSSSSSAGGYSGGSTGYSGGGSGGSHSSGSSGGSSGYSGGSSGGYSGGSHSSASGGSSSGGNYSGSHSSASSGSSSGSSGGSHSAAASAGSPSRPSGNSGGSPSSSHANTYSPVAGSSGDIHGGSRESSSRSNIRVSNMPDVNGSSGRWSENSRPGGTSSVSFRSLPTNSLPASGRPDSIQDQAWIHQPFQLEVRSNTLDKKSLAHVLTERGREVGLAPNKSAYQHAMVALSAPESHHVSWVGKLFGVKPTSTRGTPVSQLRPCKDRECGHNPHPKPCVGAKCPKPGPPKPLPPPVGTVCRAGFHGVNGACQPWGYIRDCTYYGVYGVNSNPGNCRIQWAAVDSGYCWRILREIQHQQKLLQQTIFEQGVACSTAPQGPICAKLTQDLNDESAQIRQLQQQYQMCTAASASHYPLLPGSSSFTWPIFPWP